MSYLILRIFFIAVGLFIVSVGLTPYISEMSLIPLKTGRNSVIPTLYAIFGDTWGMYIFAACYVIFGGLVMLLGITAWPSVRKNITRNTSIGGATSDDKKNNASSKLRAPSQPDRNQTCEQDR